MGAYDGLEPEFAGRLQALIAASGGLLGPGSGARSIEDQIRLRRENGCRDIWTAPASSCRIPTAIPGRSNHNHGLAMDLTDMSTGRAVQPGSAADRWLQANVAAFGLRRPVGAPGQKGWEPWHVEPAEGDDFLSGVMNGASQRGAVGFNVNYLDEDRKPEDELADRLGMVMQMLVAEGPEGTGEALAGEGMENEAEAEALGTETTVIPGEVGPTRRTVGTAFAPGNAGAGSSNAYGQYALQRFAQFGWGPEELNALTTLWNRESGNPKARDITWNPAAANPTSSARGIAQKMTSVHGPLEPTWQGQIDWGLNYIAERYGSPSQALAFHNRRNWY